MVANHFLPQSPLLFTTSSMTKLLFSESLYIVYRYLNCETLVISPNWSSSSRNKAVSSSRCREDNGNIAGTLKQWKQLVGANWSGPDSVLRSSDTFRVGACSAAAAAARRVWKKYRTLGPQIGQWILYFERCWAVDSKCKPDLSKELNVKRQHWVQMMPSHDVFLQINWNYFEDHLKEIYKPEFKG